jgi:hypothetical protein
VSTARRSADGTRNQSVVVSHRYLSHARGDLIVAERSLKQAGENVKDAFKK